MVNTLKELVDHSIADYEMRDKYKYAREVTRLWRKHLGPFFGGIAPDKLTTANQKAYRALRERQKASVATINRELQVLRRAYQLGHRETPPLVANVPYFLVLPEKNARKVFIDMPTLEKMRAAASKIGVAARCCIELAYTYGWRRGEMAALLVQDVDLFEGTVRLQTSKNGDPREAPVPDSLRPHLEAVMKDKKPTDRLIGSIYQIHDWFQEIKAAAGATDKRLHDFRRTSARVKRSAGVPTSVIMELQGWKSEAMFRRYAIVDRQDKLDALRRQAAYEEGLR